MIKGKKKVDVLLQKNAVVQSNLGIDSTKEEKERSTWRKYKESVLKSKPWMKYFAEEYASLSTTDKDKELISNIFIELHTYMKAYKI